jgi:hypothetical protein
MNARRRKRLYHYGQSLRQKFRASICCEHEFPGAHFDNELHRAASKSTYATFDQNLEKNTARKIGQISVERERDEGIRLAVQWPFLGR